MISWDPSRQAIPRWVLFLVCKSYLEATFLLFLLMALPALLHPHRPLCPMRFYPSTPVSFLHFVFLSLSLSFVYSFAPLLSSLYFSVLARRLASKSAREGRRGEGKKLESNRFLNGHRNYFLPDSTKKKRDGKGSGRNVVVELTNDMCSNVDFETRCVRDAWRYPVHAITFLKTKVTWIISPI